MIQHQRLAAAKFSVSGARTPVFALVALLGVAGPVLAEGAAGGRASAEATGALRSREAQGWLSLEADQRQARARAAPLSPAESRQLQIEERQERARLAETFQDQQRQIDALRRTERLDSAPPGQEARMRGLLMRQEQALQGLRLRQSMNRSIQRGAGSPFGRR